MFKKIFSSRRKLVSKEESKEIVKTTETRDFGIQTEEQAVEMGGHESKSAETGSQKVENDSQTVEIGSQKVENEPTGQLATGTSVDLQEITSKVCDKKFRDFNKKFRHVEKEQRKVCLLQNQLRRIEEDSARLDAQLIALSQEKSHLRNELQNRLTQEGKERTRSLKSASPQLFAQFKSAKTVEDFQAFAKSANEMKMHLRVFTQIAVHNLHVLKLAQMEGKKCHKCQKLHNTSSKSAQLITVDDQTADAGGTNARKRSAKKGQLRKRQNSADSSFAEVDVQIRNNVNATSVTSVHAPVNFVGPIRPSALTAAAPLAVTAPLRSANPDAHLSTINFDSARSLLSTLLHNDDSLHA